MEMEEDMEVEQVFTAHEVDIDYEFDAARFFDFSRHETPVEARRAELWFESAKSYPPSPVVTRMILGGDILLGNVNTSPKSKDVENTNGIGCNIGAGQESCAMDVNSGDCEGMNKGIFGNLQRVLNQSHGAGTGLTFNHSKGQNNSSVKPSFPRKSTLMKPTASQLAKQNRLPHIGGSRFQTLHVQNSDKSFCSSSGVETQATKRQKLEGGHSQKVTTEAMQQTNFIHKAPKKVETFDKTHAKLKITIPIEPDFETTYRAQRIRPKNGSVLEQVPSAPRKFKARPLNKKIFEAPSLPLPKRSTPKLPEFHEFRLKTMERAMQNTSTVPLSSHHFNGQEKVLDKPSASTVAGNGNREPRRPSKCLKQDGSDVMPKFKARPLNKKIFSSKGDIGVFWNSKRETTVPMEFNFQTERRTQQIPPTDLFSKLSLTSELQPNKGTQFNLPQPTSVSVKDSKENRANNFQPEHKIMVKEKSSLFGGKQALFGGARSISDVDNKSRMRSLGVR
ncbi:putative TPX2 central domain-containing protein [Rosa chinensis]|uniref:Putative TPX2 central domain-containing protein n=1 Tax=Rosa chinensis TaxID=74649 RepID=A0A2P6P7M9_ROSCH|nr:protein TPX2 isoform X1 [Rosa chinensis]PRQ17936.1 putative TPX2 central domain-containing protein [Rosa chinensis]